MICFIFVHFSSSTDQYIADLLTFLNPNTHDSPCKYSERISSTQFYSTPTTSKYLISIDVTLNKIDNVLLWLKRFYIKSYYNSSELILMYKLYKGCNRTMKIRSETGTFNQQSWANPIFGHCVPAVYFLKSI